MRNVCAAFAAAIAPVVAGFAVPVPMLVALLLAGCNSVDLDPSPPAGFDLSGRWTLNRELSDAPLDPRVLDERFVEMPIGAPPRDGPPGGALASVAHDFPVLTATELDIEQNADSMGVAYDGGNYRDVSWGHRQRGIWEVWTGWEEGRLVIVSEAEDARARETVTLVDGGRRAVVELAVSTRQRDIVIRRVYDRVD